MLLAQTGDPVRTGIIGTGNRGGYLLRTVLELPGTKVTALCDLKPDRLDKAATSAARDTPATFTDYRRLLERKDVDAVFIATPCDLHVEMAIAALQRRQACLLREARRDHAGIDRENWCGGARPPPRVADRPADAFGRAPAAVMAKLREGVAGKIIMVKAQRHAGDDLDHDGPSADWFFDARRSGDVIVEMAVHNLDVCNWVIGSRPERAAGFGGALLWKNDPPGRTNMDGYTLSYDYANGVKLSFTQVFFHPSGLPGNGQYFYVYGTEGAVDVSGGVFYPRRRGAKPVPLVEPATRGPAGRDPHIAAFFEAIRTGGKTPAGIEIGATAALTAILGREAIYQRKVTEWREFGVDL